MSIFMRYFAQFKTNNEIIKRKIINKKHELLSDKYY